MTDSTDEGADEFFDHRHDYKTAIENSTVAEDYELTGEAVDNIAFALNEYQAGREEGHIEALRKAKRRAGDDLSKAHRALTAAVKAFAAIRRNPYAVSALHAASGAIAERAQLEAPDHIERVACSIASLRHLTAITRQAQQQDFSDGLPTFPEGAQPSPSFETLIFRLCRVFDRFAAYTEEGTPGGMNQSTRAECIVEILAIADIRTRSGQPYGKKAIENRLAQIDETFPKIKDLDTPAN